MKNKKTHISIGLDIGTHTLKSVKLRFTNDAVELCGFDLQPVESGLGEALKKIKESEKARVNIAVSGPMTVIRYAEFPRMEEAEFIQALKFEAQKYIPFSLNEVNLDGSILKEGLPDNKMHVLIAAVRKELVVQRLKLLEEARIKVNLIDIDALSLINAFNFSYGQDQAIKEKPVALLNIGATTSNLDILENGIPYLSRDISVAGNNFTHRIADTLGIDFKSAEAIKVNPDSQQAAKMAGVIEPVLANLAEEIITSFDYYESQGTSSVAKLFLSGGGSKLTGLKDMLANSLGKDTEYWEPLKGISLSNNIDSKEISAGSGQLAVAVGLALR